MPYHVRNIADAERPMAYRKRTTAAVGYVVHSSIQISQMLSGIRSSETSASNEPLQSLAGPHLEFCRQAHDRAVLQNIIFVCAQSRAFDVVHTKCAIAQQAGVGDAIPDREVPAVCAH